MWIMSAHGFECMIEACPFISVRRTRQSGAVTPRYDLPNITNKKEKEERKKKNNKNNNTNFSNSEPEIRIRIVPEL